MLGWGLFLPRRQEKIESQQRRGNAENSIFLDTRKNVCYTNTMGTEELSKYIVLDSKIRFGKPCIKGTRITVGDILAFLSSGMSAAEIVEDFPELTPKSISAALAFAARRDAVTEIVSLEAAP
jgi:uncharacterized protein (DUF433 family)